MPFLFKKGYIFLILFVSKVNLDGRPLETSEKGCTQLLILFASISIQVKAEFPWKDDLLTQIRCLLLFIFTEFG